jgi:hypothetical protein
MAVEAQAAFAASVWHPIEKPLEKIIWDLLGIGDTDMFGIAKRTPRHP